MLTLGISAIFGGTAALLASGFTISRPTDKPFDTRDISASEFFAQVAERWRALTCCFARKPGVAWSSGPNEPQVTRTRNDQLDDTTPPLEVGTAKIRIQAKGDNLVEAWSKELRGRSQEVLETLQAEGIWIEAYFLERDSEGTSLIAYLKGKDLKRAAAIARRSVAPINQYHREFKESAWQEVRHLQRLVSEEPHALPQKSFEPSLVRCFKVEIDPETMKRLQRLPKTQKNDFGEVMRKCALVGLSIFFETRRGKTPVIWIFQHQMGPSDGNSAGREIFRSLLSHRTVGRWEETELSPLLHFENKNFDD